MTTQETEINYSVSPLANDFAARSADLTEAWILYWSRFEDHRAHPPVQEEEHSAIDFGTPGPLVHFMERFYGKGYEEKLIESVRRKPTRLPFRCSTASLTGQKRLILRRRLDRNDEGARLNPHCRKKCVAADKSFLGEAFPLKRHLAQLRLIGGSPGIELLQGRGRAAETARMQIRH